MSHLDCDSLASFRTQAPLHATDVDDDDRSAPHLQASSDHRAIRIQITQFINPHLFWFKCCSPRRATAAGLAADVGGVGSARELEALELLVAAHVERAGADDRQLNAAGYRPRRGELVAVQHLVWDRWVRARCDEAIELAGTAGWTFVLWAVDHG